MRGYLYGLICCKVPLLRLFVATTCEHAISIGVERTAKHGRIVIGRGLPDRLAARENLPAADLIIPACRD